MAKIQRTEQKIFAGNAGSQQITEFGTAKSSTPNYTQQVSVIQNANYLQGWASALLPDKSPWEEDMNALFYAITKQLAYIFQEGIPEYDPNTEYSQNALARGVGSNVIYCSAVAENLGHSLNDPNYWTPYITGGTLAGYEIGKPEITLSNTLLANEIWLEGGKVAKNLYPKLVAIYGNTYAPSTATDTDTYLYLPDFRNRAIIGASSFGYAQEQLPNITIPYSDWTSGTVAPGTIPKGTLIVGSGRNEKQETLESLRGAVEDMNAIVSGSFMPPGIKVRVKTRYQ